MKIRDLEKKINVSGSFWEKSNLLVIFVHYSIHLASFNGSAKYIRRGSKMSQSEIFEVQNFGELAF